MHQNEVVEFDDNFQFRVERMKFEDVELPEEQFNVIFFDAFSPDVQPELWSTEVFQKIADASENGAVLTTYSCKGIVKRALKTAGFEIEKLPGPPGKREILRAILK